MMNEKDEMDGKQKALLMLTMAAQGFFNATLAELEAKKLPGRAQSNRVLFEDGLANICISIQLNSKEIRAALAMVKPEFIDVLSAYELKLCGPLAAVFGDCEEVSMIDLGKLN